MAIEDKDSATDLSVAPVVGPDDPRRITDSGIEVKTVYTREDDDLFMNTANPIVLRRTYQSADQHSRQFGVNATHPGEWWLHGDGDQRVPWGELILPDGAPECKRLQD